MEVGRAARLSISGRSEGNSVSPTFDRAKLATSAHTTCHGQLNHHEQPQEQQQQHLRNRTTNKMTRNRVQVVYYLTRNGQLEHPHFMEVSHLATQPLRLKDVIYRLTELRGKAMPYQYSWSCKRSYKNGYVWNDLTENDVIYACEGSEYVLKGSEIIHETHFSEASRLEELQIKRRLQRKGDHMNTDGLVTNKSRGTHNQRLLHNHRQVSITTHNGKHQHDVKNYEQTTENDHHGEDDDEEEKGSCNSSNNAPYASLQMEQEECLSMPSTSSTNSDKQPPPPPQPPTATPVAAAAESKRYHQKEASRVIQEDGDTAISTSLGRNSTALLHLIACGGGAIVGPKNKAKANANNKNIPVNSNGSGSDSNRNLNFSMKNSLMPCLKQQLSSRGVITSSHMNPLHVKERRYDDDDVDDQVIVAKKKEEEEDDEDMMMVRYMSENPRFGNLQSEEKEYFSGTIVEATSTDHHHTHSSVSAFTHPPALTKSSSYNEHSGSTKAGSQAEAAASRVRVEDDDEREDAKVRGIIKLSIPRKKSFGSSTSIKHIC